MSTPVRLYFADATVASLERDKTLPMKFDRMLGRLDLPARVKDRTVAIKMHLGGDIGYTTIPPVFVRILVQALKNAGAKAVMVIDGKDPKEGIARGYTPEVLGCPVVSCFGPSEKYLVAEPICFRDLDEVLFGGVALDVDVYVNLSHVKGHGACGFGGALKNIAMGLVPPETRTKLHRLEGGLTIDHEKCAFCGKCFDACPNEAIVKNDEKREISFFFHHCTFCQHCVLTCPADAITMENRTFDDFAQGMALTAAAFLKRFPRERTLFINVITNVTMYCDCWGFSSPALVPDVGILVGDDCAAIDTASLDLIRVEDLIEKGLPKNRKLLAGEGHLFERLHGKDPYLMVKYLTQYHDCTTAYELTEVR